MARAIPFFFCRYQFLVDDEPLDIRGQANALKELQGRFFAHGPTAERESHLDSVVMRPRQLKVDGEVALMWSVGRRIGPRLTVGYDPDEDELTRDTVVDEGVNYSDFVAVPRLGVLAVDDRAGAPHLGGKAAINRFRSIFRNIPGGDVAITLTTRPQDVERALAQWSLTEFSFVVRPYNPHPPGDLSKRLSEQLEKDGIGRYTAKAQPVAGRAMHAAEDGHIASVVELSEAGYGQFAVKGVTGEGHVAQIKRPKFEDERTKNQQRQLEPRELRVIVTVEGDDVAAAKIIVKSLVNFYD
jgi:hypothetical protein